LHWVSPASPRSSPGCRASTRRSARSAAGTAGAVALGGIGAAVGKTGVDFLGLQEQALTAFGTLLGSSSAGQAFFDKLQSFAATTPFELPGVLKTSQYLLAMGFNARDIIPDLTAVGNAVSATGGGQAELDRVATALGQIRAKGKVQGDEMLQLTENNINAWQYLADFLHTDIPNAMKMVTKGQVSSEQGLNAILGGLAKDPKFAGMMEKQSHTFTGLVSNMHDYWNKFSGVVMQPVFDQALKPGLEWLTGWMSGPGMAFGTQIGQRIALGMAVAGRAVRGIMGVFSDFRGVLGGGVGGGGIGGKLAVGFLLIKDTVTRRVLPAIKLLWNTFAGNGPDPTTIIMGIVNAVEKVGRWFQLGIDAVVTFKQALQGVWTLNGGGNDFVNMIGRIGLAFRDLKTAFDAGGWSAFFGRRWTGYVQPGLKTLWSGLTGWIGTNGPGIVARLVTWGLAFASWAGRVYTDYLLPGLVALYQNKWAAGPGHEAMLRAMGALLTEENVNQWLRQVLIPPALTIGWRMGQDLGAGIWKGLQDFFSGGGTNQVINGVPVSPGFGGGGGSSDGGRGGSQLNAPANGLNLMSARGGGLQLQSFSGNGGGNAITVPVSVTIQGATTDAIVDRMVEKVATGVYGALKDLLGEGGGGGGGMTTGPVY
jgi:tape measure domain-containing protein